MGYIGDTIAEIKEELAPFNATLIAVTKTYPAETVREAYDAGHKVFGENKVQEMQAKQPLLPEDVQWHLIGHLQTNKVKYAAPFVSMIHSVDSIRLLAEINKQALKNNRIIPCLLQIHIAEEETKFGLSASEATELLLDENYRKMTHIRIEGVMGMATFTEDQNQIRKEFRSLRLMFDELRKHADAGSEGFRHISMGMSGDYKIALEEGSTLVRIGSRIFGSRN